MIKEVMVEIKNIKSSHKELREFGLTIGAILVILGSLALWRGKCVYPYLLAAGAFFIVFGLLAPQSLKWLQIAWMAFGAVLGFFTSRIVLAILFYAVITPISFLTKILGKDILDERIDKARTSYWQERAMPKKDKSSYENQY